ncbi:hypothetical protein NU195Hw_g5575t1 [Hortaea werneckii]
MPGAGKQPPEVQQQIKELLEAGFDPTTIHRRLKVGRSSIYRMKRCLATHGTAYTPEEHNKKNGRPKVLTAEQELEVRNWLRDPKNRGRYLDDLVWLIHERYGVVCSTTTMSKMRRKWLKVVECEETGGVLDDETRKAVWETHPDLEVLQRIGPEGGAPMVPMMTGPISNALEGDPHENGGGGRQNDHELGYSTHPMQQQQQQQEQDPAMEQPFQDHFHSASEHQHPYEQSHPAFPQQEPPTDHMASESNHYPLPPPIHHPYPSNQAPTPPPTDEPPPTITTSAAEELQQQQQQQQQQQHPLTDPQLQHIGPPPPPQLDPQIDPRFQELQSQALDAHLQQQLQQEMAGHDERQRQQQQLQQEQHDAVPVYGEV